MTIEKTNEATTGRKVTHDEARQFAHAAFFPCYGFMETHAHGSEALIRHVQAELQTLLDTGKQFDIIQRDEHGHQVFLLNVLDGKLKEFGASDQEISRMTARRETHPMGTAEECAEAGSVRLQGWTAGIQPGAVSPANIRSTIGTGTVREA